MQLASELQAELYRCALAGGGVVEALEPVETEHAIVVPASVRLQGDKQHNTPITRLGAIGDDVIYFAAPYAGAHNITSLWREPVASS